ncbi:hypothetical protein BASA61_007535 [Batrachochytrium salamandrivorans]|nr:hypothetical protein BASA61_007535 [Batrachochytrium salamandrivorans]
MIVRSLLANELKDTNSVIYELRGNPGGSVSFSDGMVQLFKPDFHPFGDSYLMNNVTYNLFAKDQDPNTNPYAKAWQETKPGSRYTNVFFSSSMESANTLGQAYVRPMGVFNDGLCYSSCDVFSGAIQSHGVGTVFGEDDFQKFPFTQELTNGSTTYANALTVGVTKTIRVGLYNGQEIEDLGVKADVVFRPRWSDLQPNSTTNSQYDRIAEHLARIGRKNGQSKLHFVSEPFSIVKPLGLSLPVSAAATTLGNSQITIVGKAAGKQVLKTIRSVRSIPTDDKYMKIGTPGFTFSGLSESVGLYQSSVTAPADGWNNLNGPWMIGNGVKVNVGLDVALDTEPEFDFLYLSVKSSGDVEDFLINSRGVNDTTKKFDGVSGGNMTVKGVFPFTTKSKKFSVALKFVSDEGLEFSGATIRSFTQLLSTSIAHLVVECEQVTGHRIQSGLVPAIQKSRLRLLGRALDPGVENVYTWLRGGVLNGEADLDQRWLDGTVEHESMGTRHDNRALAARLADFLQFIQKKTTATTATTTTATVDLFTTTTSTTTMDFSTYVLSFTVDLSESTLSPTITYTLSSTTITTSPSTTSTTSPYLPNPPSPGGYVRPPPPSPGGYVRPNPPSPGGYVRPNPPSPGGYVRPPPPYPGGYVVDEIQRCSKPAKI